MSQIEIETLPQQRADGPLSIGVEEELHVVQRGKGILIPDADELIDNAKLGKDEAVHELRLSQVEIVSHVCHSLDEVRSEICRLRKSMADAAAKSNAGILAAATHPFSPWADQPFTPERRYEEMAVHYQQLAREQIICGMHVHVGIEDRDAAVGVMNRVRPWLSGLLALSANSPYWMGSDTGYASYRTELWLRWPMAGPAAHFASYEEYQSVCKMLVDCSAIDDITKIYWDARLPAKVPTIEIRVCDVCSRIDDAVMLTGLIRALVQTCYKQHLANEPFEPARYEILRAAAWFAARFGIEGKLIDVEENRAVPARKYIERLLTFVEPALRESGDWDEVSRLVRDTLDNGNGALRQRAVFLRAGNLNAVVEFLVNETTRDC